MNRLIASRHSGVAWKVYFKCVSLGLKTIKISQLLSENGSNICLEVSLAHPSVLCSMFQNLANPYKWTVVKGLETEHDEAPHIGPFSTDKRLDLP